MSPQIDVTDLILDPYIAGEKFTVYRRTEAVNQYGEPIIGVQIFNDVVGQVSPISGNELVRQPAYSAQDKAINVITKFPLTGATEDIYHNNYQPDLVLWKGTLFILFKLEDFTKYGAGFVQAICTSYDWVVKITAIPPSTTNFVITADGQFILTPDGQFVTSIN